MPIERGFVTNGRIDLWDSLDVAGQLGVDFVEILMHGTGDRSTIETSADRIRERLDEHDLDCLVHLPFQGIDIGSPHEHVQEGAIKELEASIRAADSIDARKGVLHPTSSASNSDERRQLMSSGLQRLVDVGEDYGLEICAENIFDRYVTVRDIDDVVDTTNASLTFDTGHARIEGYSAEKAASFLDEYRDRVSHVHLNDIRGSHDEHIPFGAGAIDFETLLDPLLSSDWDGTLSLEVETQSAAYIAHSKDHLDQLL